VELISVVVVMALVSAVVILRWSGVHHAAVAESTLSRLETVDQHLRHFARSRGRTCVLEIDAERGRFRKQYDLAGGAGPAWESLGRVVRIEKTRIGGEKPRRAAAVIPFNAVGASPTYGLHIVGPGKREAWLVFAGVSGEMTQFESERQWNAAFELLTPPSL
jgi:hypothetical protein